MTFQLTPEQLNARKRRNVWIALGLVAFMVLLFTTTFLRMMHNQKEARAERAALAASSPMQPTGRMAPASGSNP